MRAFRIILRSVGVAALLALLIVVLLGGGTEPLAVGTRAPPVERARLPDGRIANMVLGSKPTVVNIWATWCPPCIAEIPDLVRVHQKWAGRVTIVGLAADSPREKVLEFIERFGIDYQVAEIDGHTAHAWNATSLPSTYIVGADGRVLWSVRGQIDGATIERELLRLFPDAPPG
jgi:cytochrome c biogenesis protein CcmG, thiol:disulfide interchange protein DsbE